MADSEKYFTKTVDGQLSVATVAQSGEIIPEETRPGDKYTTALVQTDDGPQLCVKIFDLNGGGGGSSGVTVDDALSTTSENPVQNKVITIEMNKKLQNKATGSNAITILGNATWGNSSINIGALSSAYAHGSISIGYSAYTANGQGIAIGYESSAAGISMAVGYQAKATVSSAIQLGQGTNATANTLQVFSYTLLDGTTGLIPPERLGTGYDATKTQVLKHVNGVLTWVDEA